MKRRIRQDSELEPPSKRIKTTHVLNNTNPLQSVYHATQVDDIYKYDKSKSAVQDTVLYTLKTQEEEISLGPKRPSLEPLLLPAKPTIPTRAIPASSQVPVTYNPNQYTKISNQYIQVLYHRLQEPKPYY
jgi:hypothetical protein